MSVGLLYQQADEMKYYITGCARSGTTLLRRLMNAFDGLNVCNDKEMKLDEFLASEYMVAKRDTYTLFSTELKCRDKQEQIAKLIKKDIKLIYIYRNKADVLRSANGYVPTSRYEAVMEDVRKLHKLIDFVVSYDDLLINPDQIQIQMAGVLGLTINHKWSDYPDWVNWNESINDERYNFRRIG